MHRDIFRFQLANNRRLIENLPPPLPTSDITSKVRIMRAEKNGSSFSKHRDIEKIKIKMGVKSDLAKSRRTKRNTDHDFLHDTQMKSFKKGAFAVFPIFDRFIQFFWQVLCSTNSHKSTELIGVF